MKLSKTPGNSSLIHRPSYGSSMKSQESAQKMTSCKGGQGSQGGHRNTCKTHKLFLLFLCLYFKLSIVTFQYKLSLTHSLIPRLSLFWKAKKREPGNNVSCLTYCLFFPVKDGFQSVLYSLSILMFINIKNLTRWDANRCFSL